MNPADHRRLPEKPIFSVKRPTRQAGLPGQEGHFYYGAAYARLPEET